MSTTAATARGTAPGRRAIRRASVTGAYAVAGALTVIAAWALLARAVGNPTQLPGPGAVIAAIQANWHTIPAVEYVLFRPLGVAAAVSYTAVNVMVGVALGTLLGIVLGLILARSRLVRELFEGPLLLLTTTPLLILLPFITLWFGTDRIAQSMLVIVFTMTTVTFATKNAAIAVAGHYANYAACLGANAAQTLRDVVFPAALPATIANVRVALALGWGLQAVAELLGGRSGIGRVIEITARQQATTDLFAVVLAMLVVALAVDTAVAGLGAALTRWKED